MPYAATGSALIHNSPTQPTAPVPPENPSATVGSKAEEKEPSRRDTASHPLFAKLPPPKTGTDSSQSQTEESDANRKAGFISGVKRSAESADAPSSKGMDVTKRLQLEQLHTVRNEDEIDLDAALDEPSKEEGSAESTSTDSKQGEAGGEGNTKAHSQQPALTSVSMKFAFEEAQEKVEEARSEEPAAASCTTDTTSLDITQALSFDKIDRQTCTHYVSVPLVDPAHWRILKQKRKEILESSDTSDREKALWKTCCRSSAVTTSFQLLPDSSEAGKIAEGETAIPEAYLSLAETKAVLGGAALPRPLPHKQRAALNWQAAVTPITMTKELKYPRTPAKTYPFELDEFQKRAIACIERGDNVLVAAHTSAGKTVVAEYAIARGLRAKSRVVYTSPIKALSNQKFRELKAEFDDVGLMTGDVNLNPEASVLVMTTEILRNMMVRGGEMISEIATVVFDEVHYLRDRERGVVWEETIILLPPSIQLVFLSATIPNAFEFADWATHIKLIPCHVVSTTFRPTPLVHFVYPDGAKEMFLVVDQKGQFLEDNFARALASIQGSGSNSNRGKVSQKSDPRRTAGNVKRMVLLAKEHDWLPLIVFSFNRRECEGLAYGCMKADFNTEEEKEAINLIFENAIAALNEEDRTMLQIRALLPLLLRGIGFHHSGLIPIMKELVELLFQEGLVKVLFATETFAMGVNMPARTVMFATLRKWDGRGNRFVNSSEFIQMAGRAGRRNKDALGLCILVVDGEMKAEECKTIIQGEAEPLDSKFRLSYNMILNLLLGTSALTTDTLVQQSLANFQYSLARRRKSKFDRSPAAADSADDDSDSDFGDPVDGESDEDQSHIVSNLLMKWAEQETHAQSPRQGDGADDDNIDMLMSVVASQIQKAQESARAITKAITKGTPQVSRSLTEGQQFQRQVLKQLTLLASSACEIAQDLKEAAYTPLRLLPFLQPGRVVYVRTNADAKFHTTLTSAITQASRLGDREDAAPGSKRVVRAATEEAEQLAGRDFGWCVVLGLKRKYANDTFYVDVLVPISGIHHATGVPIVAPLPIEPPWLDPEALAKYKLAQLDQPTTVREFWAKTHSKFTLPTRFAIASIQLNMIHALSAIRVVLPREVVKAEEQAAVFESLVAAHRDYMQMQAAPTSDGHEIVESGLPLLGIFEDLGLELTPSRLILLSRLQSLCERIRGLPLSQLFRQSPAAGPGDLTRTVARMLVEHACLEALARREKRLQALTQAAGSATFGVAVAAQDVAQTQQTFTGTGAEGGMASSVNGVLSAAISAQTVAQAQRSASAMATNAALAASATGRQSDSMLDVFREEIRARLRVLKRLGHISADGMVLQKGRFAAEVEGVDELVLTELVFDGVFIKYTPAQVAALLTCMFSFEKSSADKQVLPPALAAPFRALKLVVDNVAKVSNACGQLVSLEAYAASFKYSLMEVTHRWCEGATFESACEVSDIFPGSVIRIFRRLAELLIQLEAASKAIGNAELEKLFQEARKALQRGLPFADSLYTA